MHIQAPNPTTTMFSYWEHQTFLSGIDIAIVGSGIVGLSAAIHLKKSHPTLHVAVFERGMLPSGASTKNAGFACFGSVSELLMDLDTHPEDEVFSLVEKRWRGLQRIRNNIGDAAMRFESFGGYEVFDDDAFYENCADQMAYLNQRLQAIVGPQVYSPTDTAISKFGFSGVRHLIFNRFEGQLHTGHMMSALLAKAQSLGILVYNGAQIDAIDETGAGVWLRMREAAISARKVLVATNAFARQLLPDLDVTPGRGQVLVTAPIPNLRLKGTFHYDKGYVYFRDIDGRILLGGGRNLDFTGETTTEFGLTDRIQNHLIGLLDTMLLPGQRYQIDYQWSGIMGFGQQQMPIIRQVSPSVVCAVKMQGMGVALGSLTGEEAAELILAG